MKERERPSLGGDDRALWELLGKLDDTGEEPSPQFVERVLAAARETGREAPRRRWSPWALGGAAAAAAAIVVMLASDDVAERDAASRVPDADLAAVIRELEELPEEDVLALEAEDATRLQQDWLGG